MRATFASTVVLACVRMLAGSAASAADCPAALVAGHPLHLVDDKNRSMHVEALADGMVRRTEDPGQANGNFKQVVDAQGGLVPVNISSSTAAGYATMFVKFPNDDWTHVRTFTANTVGDELVTDSDMIRMPGPGERPQPTGRESHWHTTMKVVAIEKLAVGGCAYDTAVVETSSRNDDQLMQLTARMNYSPLLKTWLKTSNTVKAAGQPARTLDRTVVSVAAE